MKTLGPVEMHQWLASHNLPPDPYAVDSHSLPYYLQFHAPKRFRQIGAFVREFTALAQTPGEFLISVRDTLVPSDFETRLFHDLRPKGSPGLVDAPGHLFSHVESDGAIGMFSLTVGLEWSAYLFIPERNLILYNWEGEIFDFWTRDVFALQSVTDLLSRFELNET